MNRVVVDASAIAALAFDEPASLTVTRQIAGATIFAPALLKFELANIAWKKVRQKPNDGPKILQALAVVLESRWGIHWRDVDVVDVALVARETGLSAYDASYLWLAGTLGADLVTLDRRLAAAGEALFD
jgi:predicted nucleic acid-binding protein